MRQVILSPGEDGLWVAECPSLPGCVSQGKTKEEAIAKVEALALRLVADQTEKTQEPIKSAGLSFSLK